MRKINFIRHLGKLTVSADSKQSVHDYVNYMISQIEIVDTNGNILSPASGGSGIPNSTEISLALLAGLAILCVTCYLIYYYFPVGEEHDNLLDNTFNN